VAAVDVADADLAGLGAATVVGADGLTGGGATKPLDATVTGSDVADALPADVEAAGALVDVSEVVIRPTIRV
jgi:hypothetical protein